jgi:hypothetical protein
VSLKAPVPRNPFELFIALADAVRYSQLSHLRADDLMACLLEYWSGLVSGVNFPGRTILECLEVIHKDIIGVWDLNDPFKVLPFQTCLHHIFEQYYAQYLQCKEFKALMSNMVSDIEVGNPGEAV